MKEKITKDDLANLARLTLKEWLAGSFGLAGVRTQVMEDDGWEIHMEGDDVWSVEDPNGVARGRFRITVQVEEVGAEAPTKPDDLTCPEHRVPFRAIARTPNGPRICPRGETWRALSGVLVKDPA